MNETINGKNIEQFRFLQQQTFDDLMNKRLIKCLVM